jgi:hypothetical protein
MADVRNCKVGVPLLALLDPEIMCGNKLWENIKKIVTVIFCRV